MGEEGQDDEKSTLTERLRKYLETSKTYVIFAGQRHYPASDLQELLNQNRSERDSHG